MQGAEDQITFQFTVTLLSDIYNQYLIYLLMLT